MDREKFKEEAKKTIDELFEKIEGLEAKKDEYVDKARAEYEEKLALLKNRRKELQTKLDQLTDAADDKWDEFKDTFSSAAESFKEGFARLGSFFSKGSNPDEK